MNPQVIIQRVADHFGVGDITEQRRLRANVSARRLAASLLWDAGLADAQISGLLGVSGSTVGYHRRVITDEERAAGDLILNPPGPPPEILELRRLVDTLDVRLDALERSFT